MGDTPSKPYRAVTKNGNDQRQDKELSGLREDFREFRKEDREVHKMLTEGVGDVKERLGKYIFAGKAVWGIVALIATPLIGGVGWLIGEVAALRTSAAATHERDDGLADAIENLEDDLRRLRDLVQRHQINKDEHLQRRKE